MSKDQILLRIRYEVPEDWDSEKLRDFGLSVQAAVSERLGQILHGVSVEEIAGGGIDQRLAEARGGREREDRE